MRFLWFKDVMLLIGLGCLIIYKFMVDEIDFFKSVLFGGWVVVWVESEIEEWMELCFSMWDN